MKHRQLTSDLQEQASLYAAGAMTESEKREYLRHLEEDQCDLCRSEVNELQAAMSLIVFNIPSSAPSANVKNRLMERVHRSAPMPRQPEVKPPEIRPRSGFNLLQWLMPVAAVASLAVTIFVVRTNSELRRTADGLNSRIAQLEVQLAEQRSNVARLTSTGIRVVDMAGQGTNVQASGKLFWDQEQKKWFVYVRDLPPVAKDKSYQLWFVPKAGPPLSASVFNTMVNGTVQLEISVPDSVTDLKAAAVTTEPAGGLPQPSGSFALLGAL